MIFIGTTKDTTIRKGGRTAEVPALHDPNEDY